MTWLKRALPAAWLAILASSPQVHAQVIGRPVEISGGAGLFQFDTRAFIESTPAYTGSLGLRVLPSLSIEAAGTAGFSHSKALPDKTHKFGYAGADLRWSLRPPSNRAVPFVLTGVGFSASRTVAFKPDKLDGFAGSLGLGMLLNLGSPRAYARVQVRDVFARERGSFETNNHFAVTAGIHWVLGGKWLDQDLDGVRDWTDQCPETPIGARVDARGCPTDADRDSVFDGLDTCEGTPFGCKVEKTGCPVDSDGDGVCDGLDQCADTPSGTEVDDKGCAVDADGDSVKTPLDQCEGTPKGCAVEANGCPKDSDSDGVCDGLDQCPHTSAGAKVNTQGCPTEISGREGELLDTGVIRVRDLKFEPGSGALLPDSYPAIDAIGQILQQYPGLRIEIGAHTDDRGKKAASERVTNAQAVSVLEYAKGRFLTIDATQYSSKGYGGSSPLAPNSSELGRALNRRIEFKVLNPEVLKAERDKRKP